MYQKFFGLKELPFNVTSDPSFFFLSRYHKEALSCLMYGVSQRKGIIVVSGEIGTGKTTLCRYFLNELGKKTKSAFILNPNFSELELIEAITSDFGLKVKRRDKLSFNNELNRFLLQQAKSGCNVALIIDEAQNLGMAQLEQVRMLSNFETEKDKLIQIVLVGQPELNRTLHLHDLRQLKQRVMVQYHIFHLDRADTLDYIAHRLKIAGDTGRIQFTDEAINTIFEFSGGTPRLINVICDRCLLAAFVKGSFSIDSTITERCLFELKDYSEEFSDTTTVVQ
jgi:general secretion pathway protein A